VDDLSKVELEDRPIHFEDLVERCMGNIDLANRLLDQSQAILTEDLKLLQESCKNEDPVEIPRLAHRLKGATANIGAYELSDVFARIERHGQAGETATVRGDLLELESEWSRFLANVVDLLNEK
jgi:HPt (histidine-containing phosphotransfer) domain-containing protein